MSGTDPPPLRDLLQKRDWTGLIKQFDAALAGEEATGSPGHVAHFKLDRAHCYHQLGLYRKALKDVEDVLKGERGHGAALMLLAKISLAMKNTKDAKDALVKVLDAAAAGTADLSAAVEAQELLTALESGELAPGTKIPLFRGTTIAPKAAPAPKPAASPPPTAATAAPPSAATPKKTKDTAPPPPPPTSAAHAASIASSTSAPAGMDPMHRLVAMTDPTSALNVAVNLVNAGQNAEALAILNLMIERHGAAVAPLAARGTARALEGDLPGALADFNAAIEGAPREADFYKRRAQALGALGRDADALRDLIRAKELCADPKAAAEALADAARIHHKRRDYRRAELDIRAALDLDPTATALLPMLASCQVSQGDLAEGVATYRDLIEAGYKELDSVISLGMAQKELCRTGEAAATLRRAIAAGRGTPGEVNARRLLAQMLQGLGDHMAAVRELDAALSVPGTKEAHRVELRFLRGACYHAVGLHRQAVEDYQRTLEATPEGLAPEAVSFMCLAFYQKEMALWGRAHLDDPVEYLCLDADLLPEFKELWCKKAPPGAEFVSAYRAVMQPQWPNWSAPRPRPAPSADAVAALVAAADALGAQVQYHHQGFLPNTRQRRMAGLAALEYAQLLQTAAKARREGKGAIPVPDAGASACARGPSGVGGGGRGGTGTHALGWRDAMETIVKWRQVAEPNDQVLWVDLLTEREFSAGFGSHTPMFTGQTKCVRYYMNFSRAMEVAKRVALEKGAVVDADGKDVPVAGTRAAALAAATTAQEFWEAVGADSWVVVPVESTTRPGKMLEGTRLTVVNLSQRAEVAAAGDKEERDLPHPPMPEDTAMGLAAHGVDQLTLNGDAAAPEGMEKDDTTSTEPPFQPHSFEFSIRTPVTPARWEDYDAELAGVFDALLAALAEGNHRAAADAALRFAYYWYNFMPLARGSALCGYVSILGAFLAAGMPVRAHIPTSVQTDWEAILESSPGGFMASVGAWLLPPEVGWEAGNGAAGAATPWPCAPAEELPQVREVLATMRERLEALNGPDGPQI